MRNIFIGLTFVAYIFCIDIGLDSKSLNSSKMETYNSRVNYSSNQNNYSLLHDYIDIDSYSTGPGDIFLFNMVTSSRIVNLELIVSPPGTILIPIVGIIDVKDKSVSYVYDAIIKKCKEKYEDANVYVELIKTRSFKVLVTGDFSESGMFSVSSTNRASDLIESILNLKKEENSLSIVDSLIQKHLSDFPTNIFLSKDISLIRDNLLINIDLFNYYINGDSSSNPILKEGDIINIKNSNKITILGQVKNPIRIDKIDDMKYSDLIAIAGGLTTNANNSIIKIINHKILIQYSKNEINRISKIDSKYRSDTDESFFNSRLKTNYGILSVNNKSNLSNLLSLEVSSGDIIIVPDKIDYIEIIGGIKNPGIYKYDSKFDINNYIEKSGSFTELAKNKKIYIINQENGIRVKVNKAYSPNPGDIIFIEEKATFKSWERFSESIKLAGTLATMSLVMYNIWDQSNE